MSLQRRLLLGMLALLGLAAALGVGTIFLPGTDIIGRLAFTLLAAGVVMGAAAPLARRFENIETRTTGAVGLGAAILGFTLMLVGIWGEMFVGRFVRDELILTALTYVPAAFAGVVAFAFRRGNHRLAALFALATTIAAWASALLGIWRVPLGLSPKEDLFGETCGLLILAGLCGTASLVSLPASKRWWAWLGALASLAGLGSGLYGIWVTPSRDHTVFLQIFIIAGGVGAANTLLSVPMPAGFIWLGRASAMMAGVTALVASYVNAATAGFDRFGVNDLPSRVLAASSIVTVCGVLGVIVVKAFATRVLATHARSIDHVDAVALTCPRCAKPHRAAIGESRCAGCGLIFLLRLAEPRCVKCCYTLLDLRSGQCPECGTLIDASPKPAQPSPRELSTAQAAATQPNPAQTDHTTPPTEA
jgi:hypothetical protein